MESPARLRVRTGSSFEPWFWKLYYPVTTDKNLRNSPIKVDSYFEDHYDVKLYDREGNRTVHSGANITYIELKENEDLTAFLLRWS